MKNRTNATPEMGRTMGRVRGWRVGGCQSLDRQQVYQCSVAEHPTKGFRRRWKEETYGIAITSAVDSERRRIGADQTDKEKKKSHTREREKGAAVACLSARPVVGFLYGGIDAIQTSMLRMIVSEEEENNEKKGNVQAGDNPARRCNQGTFGIQI